MKPTILCLFLLLTVSHLRAGDSSYRENLLKLRDRCSELETEASDYRKPEPKLSPEKEEEMFRLHGQLLREDPVGMLQDQIYADIRALDAVRTKTSADAALIDTLKDLLASVSGVADQAATRAQAEEHATTLRQFVARRDVAGIRVWSEALPDR